ncbi:MAG: DUF4240 domain-containing protein [Saprospiraceae bacterium]
MTAVLKMNVQELDTKFVEDMKHQFTHSELEIRVHDQPDTAAIFTAKDFWETIGLLDWSREDDDAKVVEPAIRALESQPLAHIYRFADILSEKLWHLDTKGHAQVFLDDPEEEGYLSVDDFLYARCAVVANGQKSYEKVLNKPSEMPKDLTFEPLLYIAMNAYKHKTGKELMLLPAFNYETYSNKNGWAK